jgi:hypothetical protein
MLLTPSQAAAGGRRLSIGPVALVAVVGLALACDGGGGSQLGGPPDGGGTGGQTGGGLKFDGGGLKGGGFDVDAMVQRDPPPVSKEAIKLPFPNKARLIGDHTSSCSNEAPEGATLQSQVGDRWCGFFVSGELIGQFELWVFNYSQTVRAPGSVACTDPNGTHCRRMTADLWTAQPDAGPVHPYSHGFQGDTLIFYADAVSGPDDIYKGFVYGWRPGWAQPRRLTDRAGFRCSGHPRAPVALCLGNLEEDETKPFEFDLFAGTLSDSADSALPFIDRIHPDTGGAEPVTKWRAAFNRSGDTFVYSTGRTDKDRENLWAIPSVQLKPGFQFNARATTPLLTNAARFTVSRDGKKIYYLENFVYSSTGDPTGILKMADFPSAANPTVISDKIGAYLLLGKANVDAGVGLFYDVAVGKGTLRLLPNPAVPGDYKTIVSNIGSALVTADQKYTAFSRSIDEDTGLGDLSIVDNSKATKEEKNNIACVLQSRLRTDFYGTPFLESNGLVFWTDDVDSQLQVGKGMYARPDCTGKDSFATDVDFWFTVGDRGIIFSDSTDIDIATIRFSAIANNTLQAGGPKEVQVGANRVYNMMLPEYGHLLYELSNTGKPEIEGLYTYKLPFALTPTPPSDAGVADSGN